MPVGRLMTTTSGSTGLRTSSASPRSRSCGVAVVVSDAAGPRRPGDAEGGAGESSAATPEGTSTRGDSPARAGTIATLIDSATSDATSSRGRGDKVTPPYTASGAPAVRAVPGCDGEPWRAS